MNKREAILFLEKKRDKAIGYMSFFGEGNRKGLMNEIRVNTYDIAINTLQQIDEPQAEKVEVPDYVAEWIEYAKKKGHAVIESANPWDLYGAEWKKADDWINQNQDSFARAFMDGYTVKPKRWVVKNEEGYYFVTFSKYAKTPFEGVFSASVTDLVTFDDKAKAEAVAVLVEGSVEEVAE